MTDEELTEMKERWSAKFGQLIGHRLVVDHSVAAEIILGYIVEIERLRAEVKRVKDVANVLVEEYDPEEDRTPGV